MSAGKQAFWLFFTLISLAFTSWYFAASNTKNQLDEQTLTRTVDVIIQDLEVRQYDAQGHLVNRLNTPLLKHTPQQNKHWFKAPRIEVREGEQPPWEISANEATSLDGGQQITFSQDVVIHQAKHPGSPESTLKTEEIIYYPKNKKATTEKHVMFFQPGNHVESEGMVAWLDQKRVQLTGNARGRYDPTHG